MHFKSFFPVMVTDFRLVLPDVLCEKNGWPCRSGIYAMPTVWGIINDEQLAELILSQNTICRKHLTHT